MTKEALMNETKNGTYVVHQMVSRGHKESLRALLPILLNTLGTEDCAKLINQQVGIYNLGAVDLSCKNCLAVVDHLKDFGGVNKQPPPPNWKKGRRYHQGSRASRSGGADNSGRFREYARQYKDCRRR